MGNIKELHDKLLAEMPEVETHSVSDCVICSEQATDLNINDSTTRGGDKMTYTEEELTTAVKEAIAPIKAAADDEIARLKDELEAVQSAQAEQETAGQIAEIQSKLDEAELRASKASQDLDDVLAFLADVQAEAEAAEAREVRRSEVRSLVKEAAGFRDEYIEENLDRWVDMTPEVFEATLEDYKAARQVPVEVKEEETSSESATIETAISNVRSDDVKVSTSAAVFGARESGFDVRKLSL